MSLTENEQDLLRLMLAIPNSERLKGYSYKTDEEIRAELAEWLPTEIERVENSINSSQDRLNILNGEGVMTPQNPEVI